MHTARLSFLCCVGILLLLSGCSGSEVIVEEPSQSLESVEPFIVGTVLMPDSSRVPGALVMTEPGTDNKTADVSGDFRFTRRLLAGSYTIIARHPDPEYADLVGREPITIRDGQVPEKVTIWLRRPEGMELDGVKDLVVPVKKKGKSSGG